MRIAAALAILALGLAALAGCGSSSQTSSTTSPAEPGASAPPGASARACALSVAGTSALRAAHVSCGEAQRLAIAWRGSKGCEPAAAASQTGCSVRGYRCIGARTDRGWSVSCARPGRAIAFISKR